MCRLCLLALLTVAAGAARAAPPQGPERAGVGAAEPRVAPTYALTRLDALGLAPEIVAQLEGILRVELERAIGRRLPARNAVERAMQASPALADCTADPTCLAPLARSLKVTRVIAGNVGGLADSYIVNLKLVDDGGRELRRVAATLRGSPDELIHEVRVAALRLVAPERLVGSLAILSEVPGATVSVDGNAVGRTPLAAPLAALSIGVHHLAVERPGYSPFAEDVPVRYEKTTQVMVRQLAITDAARREQAARTSPRKRIYERWYFWVGTAAVAVGAAVAIGFAVPKQDTIHCMAGKPCP
jgi:PEGA domain